jgi:hypothetical protein
MMRKYTVAPHPFILEPSVNNQRTYKEGEDLSFGLTLIGRATDYLPYFIYALDELEGNLPRQRQNARPTQSPYTMV